MKQNKPTTLHNRLTSFGYAFQGIRQVVKQEPNARIHALATVIVIVAGLFKGLSKLEWVAILLAIAAVWVTEILNTCIEMLCDLYCKGEYHPTVKIIKDLAAAAVLIAAITSVIVAAFVFLG